MMKRRMVLFLPALVACHAIACTPSRQEPCDCPPALAAVSPGPAAKMLKEVIRHRRSLRSFGPSISEQDVRELLWAAQGVTEATRGHRAAPSAGATYPLDLYVAVAEGVDGLAEGLYRYVPQDDQILSVGAAGSYGEPLAEACVGQRLVAEAQAVFVFVGVPARIEPRYRGRSKRYTLIEVGHSAQNLLLTAQARGLGGCPIGAFDDAHVAALLTLPEGHEPLYVVPVGASAQTSRSDSRRSR